MAVERYKHQDLLEFGSALCRAAGLSEQCSLRQTSTFVEADLMGHTTHGLNLLPNLLNELVSGILSRDSEFRVLSDSGSTVFWDGNMAAGGWLVSVAVDEACVRAKTWPIVTFVIKRSGHIGALSAHIRAPAERGFLVFLMTTNPKMRTVAPPGGMDAILAPNPIGFGYPTDQDPVLIDISTSCVANGWIRRWAAEGKALPEKWIQSPSGEPSDNPSDLFGSPPGTLLPLGGSLLGYKGFGLGLMVEALTTGLAGVDYDDGDAGNLVYLQIIDPRAFAGAAHFTKSTDQTARTARKSRPIDANNPVRLPGDRALALRRKQLLEGVELHSKTIPQLASWATRFGIELPVPMAAVR